LIVKIDDFTYKSLLETILKNRGLWVESKHNAYGVSDAQSIWTFAKT